MTYVITLGDIAFGLGVPSGLILAIVAALVARDAGRAGRAAAVIGVALFAVSLWGLLQ